MVSQNSVPEGTEQNSILSVPGTCASGLTPLMGEGVTFAQAIEPLPPCISFVEKGLSLFPQTQSTAFTASMGISLPVHSRKDSAPWKSTMPRPFMVGQPTSLASFKKAVSSGE